MRLEELAVSDEIRDNIFGEIPIQVGWCRGYNNTCNALEYHKSSELIVAVTDLLLILGRVDEIIDDSYEISKAKSFFVPKNSVIELYPMVLHFAPIQTDGNEFIAIIILPKSTNLPLERGSYPNSGSNKNVFLFAKNKWLLAYPGTTLADMGATIAIKGTRIIVKTESC
jgi:hypothetical protein